tara:strand:+ start:534 stop:881 length:348 start_codon:yes stop_codon:yes gene_type:complete
MKKLITSLLVLTVLFISSCATVATKSIDLEPGMSKTELTSLLGRPGDRQFSGNVEAWQYCDTGFAKDEYLIVWLANGIVVETQRYENAYSMGMCSSFTTINWEDAPDKIIEFRER